MVRKIYNPAFRLAYQTSWSVLDNYYQNHLTINRHQPVYNDYFIFFNLFGFSTSLSRLKKTSKGFITYFFNKQIFLSESFFQETFQQSLQQKERLYFKQTNSFFYFSKYYKKEAEKKRTRLINSYQASRYITSKFSLLLSSAPVLSMSSVKSVLIEIFLLLRKLNPALVGIKAIISGRWFDTLDNRTKKMSFLIGNSSSTSTSYYSSYNSLAFLTSFGSCNVKLLFSYQRFIEL